MPIYKPVCRYDTAGQGYDESLYDISVLTDAISLSIVDSKIISGTKTEAETLSIIDTISKTGTLTLSELLHIIDIYITNVLWTEESKAEITWIEETKI